MALGDKMLRRLRRHRVPAWWLDAKLGVFVHWTPASVPAFAPVEADITDLVRSGRPDALAGTPYAEWYENSLRFPDSPVARHHRELYGDRPYETFAADWVTGLADWDPDAWAHRFVAAGARWVVMVTKHMDGFCLWPTEVPNPRRPGWHSERDVVGELCEAVRRVGMRFGVYYSGGLDSTFNDHAIGSMADLLAAVPRADYPAYAEAQVRELIARYRPSVLWNDIAWPGEARRLWPLLEHYYEQVPDGVVNDRWLPWSPLFGVARSAPGRRAIDADIRRRVDRAGALVPPSPPHFDVRTPEYTRFAEVQPDPWECVRGMDRSFGYNRSSRPEDFITRDDLLWLLADVVATGGNLLLNVGPRGVDAQIPEQQAARLEWLGDWVGINAEAITASRPWVRPGTESAEGVPVRYTTRAGVVYAFLGAADGAVTLSEVRATPTTAVEAIDGTPLTWRDSPTGLTVEPPVPPAGPGPAVVVLRAVEARATPPQF